jgi:hypothetical protein
LWLNFKLVSPHVVFDRQRWHAGLPALGCGTATMAAADPMFVQTSHKGTASASGEIGLDHPKKS